MWRRVRPGVGTGGPRGSALGGTNREASWSKEGLGRLRVSGLGEVPVGAPTPDGGPLQPFPGACRAAWREPRGKDLNRRLDLRAGPGEGPRGPHETANGRKGS